MSDIVARLQRDDLLPADHEILCVEAADEIKKLRAAAWAVVNDSGETKDTWPVLGELIEALKGGEDETT